MLNPKYRRYADRLKALIEESRHIASLEKPAEHVGPYIQDKVALNSWLIKIKNIIEVAFGLDSLHYKELQRLTKGHVEHSCEVKAVEGLLTGALDDLESGFLLKHEFLVAGEIFDSVLDEAKLLLKTGHKDVAAVLCRVILENALQRIARQEEIDSAQKTSKINDELKKIGRFGQPQWRLIQAWLDIGNFAAHGKFNEYDDNAVRTMIEGTEHFIANELGV